MKVAFFLPWINYRICTFRFVRPRSQIMGAYSHIQMQLRQLRETMPRLVEPLLAHHASPEDLYSNYSSCTLDTAKAIKALTKFMQEPSSQETLKRAKISRAVNPEGIRPWMVTEHADWLEVRNIGADADAANTNSSQQEGDEIPFPSTDEISSALEKFKRNHPGIEVIELDSNRHNFEVRTAFKFYLSNTDLYSSVYRLLPIYTSRWNLISAVLILS